jgi:predicted kinase
MTYESALAAAKRAGTAWGCACGTVNTSARSDCNECGNDMPAELLGDRSEGFEMSWEEWIAMQVGPRVVGGRYDHGDPAGAYEVLAIDRGPRPLGTWPVWEMTVRYDRDRQDTTHCSGWNAARGRVLSPGLPIDVANGYTAEEWAALTPIERLADQALRRSRAIPETEQCPHCEGMTGELRYTPGGDHQLWVPCRWCGSTGRRPSPGALLVAIGPGASGKSTLAATVLVDAVVCLDSLRLEIGGDAGDQSVTPAAVARQNTLLDEHLAAGRSVFLDSTNVEEHVRRDLVARARRHGRPILALRFTASLEDCRARNRLRPANRRVPDHILDWQHALARAATEAVLLAEGFTAVYEVDTTPAVSSLPHP